MCSSAGRDSITICEGGVTAHQSQRLASIQRKTRPVLWWGISLQLPQAKWCPNWWALLWYCLHIRSEKEEWKYNPASERMKEPHRQHLEKNGKTIALFFSLIKGMFCSLPVWINCITTFEHLITFHNGCNISALSPGNCVMNNAAWLPAVIFLITWQRWKYQRRLGESSFQHP